MANNKTYSKKEALKIIVQCARRYDSELKDKRFLLAYKENNRIPYKIIEFKDFNFLHLTGVKANVSPRRFYNRCLDRRLSMRDFEFDKENQAHLKLSVLPMLPDMFYNHTFQGDSIIGAGLYVEVDYFVGTTNRLLSLGCRYGEIYDHPVSLYKEDVKLLTITAQQVVGIWRLDDEGIINTYISNNEDEGKLRKKLIADGAPL